MYKILVLDDDKNHLIATKKYLSVQGFETLVTDSPKNALHLIRKTKPDLLIVDIIMPIKSGYEFIEEMKFEPLLKNTPFLFLTAKGLTEDRIRGYNLGCIAYIAKPFNPEELIAVIKNVFFQRVQRAKEVCEVIRYVKSIRSFLENKYSLLEEDISLDLTPKERSILYYILQGFKNKEIALRLHINLRTVEKHVTAILNKTNTSSRAELITFIYFQKINLRANDGDRTRE